MSQFQHERPTREARSEQQGWKLAEMAPKISASLRYLAPGAFLQRALAAPHSLGPAELMVMQRTIGNRAAGAMLGRAVQAKLIVNAPSDEYEREADRVADAVMRIPTVPQGETPEAERSPAVMTKPASEPGGDRSVAASEDFAQRLQASQGRGRPLPPRLRETFETRFGADFSDVRVHADAAAAQLSEAIQARAFTRGPDIFLGAGQSTAAVGQRLLAHELTHVVQQGAAALKGNPKDAARTTARAPQPITQPTTGDGTRAGRIQRDPLGALATPKVFTLPAAKIQVQDQLVDELEKFVLASYLDHFPVLNLGVIELPLNLSDLMPDELIEEVQFKPGAPSSGLPPRYAKLLEYAEQPNGVDLRRPIVENALNTLEGAGQLTYLRSRHLSDSQWKILVDVHYYRDRAANQLIFHKDTIGNTLFVNLNFLNQSEISGPEYMLNPPAIPQHEEDIKGTLPKKFRDDLAAARRRLPDPTEIAATRIPAKGIVSFVDELIHHTTPHVGRRTVSSKHLAEFLKREFPNRFAAARQGDAAFFGHTREGREQYARWMDRIRLVDANAELNVTEIAEGAALPGKLVDKLFEEYSQEGFRSVAIKHGKNSGVTYPVRPGTGAPRFTRQMSRWAVKNKLPPQMPGKRRFFRTWVRAVRR